MNVAELGEYIRKQRNGSRLSLKGLSGLAGVSIPYLSQIERGLRRPSADVLQGIAKALRISAEQLYVKAGILDERPAGDVPAAIMTDSAITERQKQALVQIYEAFRQETGRAVEAQPHDRSEDRSPPPARPPARSPRRKPVRTTSIHPRREV